MQQMTDSVGRVWIEYKPGFWTPAGAYAEAERWTKIKQASDKYWEELNKHSQK